MPKPGDFGCIATHDIGGWLIRFGTRSKVNHAVLYLGRNMVVEAEPHGARTRHMTDFDDYTWSDVDLTGTERNVIVAAGYSFVGTPYSWLDILAITLAVLGVRSKWVMGRLNDPRTKDCSALVADAYKAAGIDLISDKPNHLETPGDLLDVIQHKTIPEWW